MTQRQEYLVSLEVANRGSDLKSIETALNLPGDISSRSKGERGNYKRSAPKSVWRFKSRRSQFARLEVHLRDLEPIFELLRRKSGSLPPNSEIVLRIGVISTNPMIRFMLPTLVTRLANSVGAMIELSTYPVVAERG